MLAATFLLYATAVWLVLNKLKLLGNTVRNKIIAYAIGVLLVLALFFTVQRFAPYTKNVVVTANVLRIAPEVSGRITEVYAQPNEFVERGAPLLQIDPRSYQFAVDRLRAIVAQTESGVGELGEALQAARAEVERARAGLSVAENDLRRTEQLAREGVVPQRDLDDSRDRAEAARASLDQAEAQERSARLAVESEAGGEHAALAQTLAELSAAELDLEETTIYAPSDGYVTSLTIAPGSHVDQGTPVLSFISTDLWFALGSVLENDLGEIQPGNRVEVTLEMYPGQIFNAQIHSIAAGAEHGQFVSGGNLLALSEETTQTQPYPVRLEFTDEGIEDRLRVGATGNAAIYTDAGKPLHIIRMVQIRIEALLNYLL
jgi:multidrug resistance efflux pump